METSLTAPGVDYFDYPGTALRVFRCEPYWATLSTSTCAKRSTEAQASVGDAAGRYSLCGSCPIGAAHAGRPFVSHSAAYGSMLCPRRIQGTTRMIRGEICVSCYNREREFLIGRNGKGTKPVKVDLQPRAIRYAVRGGPVATYAKPLSVDTTELVFRLLRRVPGEMIFGFKGRSPAVRQAVLF